MDTDEWTTNSTDAFTISLMQPQADGLKLLHSFQPKFTYPIFGEEETIYGYKNLNIQLRYRANDMRPNLTVSYGKKLPATKEIEVPDVRAVLENGHLPKIAFVGAKDFEESSEHMTEGWTPPGVLHKSFQAGGERFEVWKGPLNLAPVKQLVSRVQILVPLFIEGGSYIVKDGERGDDDDRWTVFFLYRKGQPPGGAGASEYTFIGYSTLYRFYCFQKRVGARQAVEFDPKKAGTFDLASLPTRSRLSQFVILPPFQGSGHGRRLYETIFEFYHKQHPQTIEFTVEDPNEEFDDLRDLADLTFLRKVPEFQALELNTVLALPTKKAWVPDDLVKGTVPVQEVRKNAKMVRRQFLRVLEMHLMSKLPASVQPKIETGRKAKAHPSKVEQHQYRLWQLFVKNRLYRQHVDALGELDLEVRLDKLDETMRNVEFEYARLLPMSERWAEHDGGAADGEARGKRRLSSAEEDEDDNLHKKARVDTTVV